jgi:hypothetical protein
VQSVIKLLLISARIGAQRTFVPFGFTLSFEKGDATIPMTPFSVERREKTPFAEGKILFGGSP